MCRGDRKDSAGWSGRTPWQKMSGYKMHVLWKTEATSAGPYQLIEKPKPRTSRRGGNNCTYARTDPVARLPAARKASILRHEGMRRSRSQRIYRFLALYASTFSGENDSGLSETRVPTVSPMRTRRTFSGLFMSKTMIGMRLSMQRLKAVESITWRRRERASP
jgi:hypothetical protein